MKQFISWLDLWRINAATVAAFLLVGFVFWVIWEEFEPNGPASIEVSHRVMNFSGEETTAFRAGDWVLYDRVIISRMSVKKEGDQILRSCDGAVFLRYPTYAVLPRAVGKQSTEKFAFEIPARLPVGCYELVVWQTYRLNHLREESFFLPPIRFQVVAP